MPRTVKKTATRRAHRAKSKGISKAQRDSLKVDLTLVMRMEEWARRHDSSLGDAIERAFSDFLDKDKQEDEKTSRKMTDEAYQDWMDTLPEEDDELNEETLKGMEESRKAYERGNFHTFDEVAEELGLCSCQIMQE